MKVIFPLTLSGTAVQYPDAINLFSNAVILGSEVVADYSGALSLTPFTGYLPTDYKPMTPLTFLQRMTQAERIATRTQAQTDANIADFMYLLDHAPTVMLNDPEVVAGIDYLGTVPSATPILTAARIAAILNPKI